MATKIGYVSQPPASQINWAEVGANFTGMLNEEARVRKEKKAEIDRATREQMKVLQNMPTGDSKNMNEWALKFGGNSQSYLLMLNAALKSGRLKPNDYTVMRQNLADGADQVLTLAQEYQNEYANKMERLKSNDPNNSSQDLEVFLMQTAEGFGNFNQSEIVINPNTGNVSVGFKNPTTGQLESDPNKLVGVNNLNNRIKGQFDKYNMDAAVLEGKKQFGKFETFTRELGRKGRAGLIVKYSDPALRSKEGLAKLVKDNIITQEYADSMSTYSDTLNAWADSQLSNVYNVTSLLTNNLRTAGGKEFKFTFNDYEQDENTILLKQVDGNVVPEFENAIGKKQYEIAKEGIKDVLTGSLDHTLETTTVSDYTAPTYAPQYVYESGKDTNKLESSVYHLGKLYSGTPEEITAATNYFRDNTVDGRKVVRNNTGVTVYTPNPTTGKIDEKFIPFSAAGGGRLSIKQFASEAAPLLTGETDVNKVFSMGKYDNNAQLNTVATEFSSEIKTTGKSATGGGYSDKVNELAYSLVENINFGLEQGPLDMQIKEIIGADIPVGDIKIEQIGYAGGDGIRLRITGYAPIELDADLYTDSGKYDQQEKLRKYLAPILLKYQDDLAAKYQWDESASTTTGNAGKYNKK